MTPVVMAITVLCFYMLFYRFYAKGLLARKIFALDDNAATPAHTMRDDVDYIPTNKYVLFGHHFASIAGLAPMLGPAIAVIWGWVPALCWVVFGTLLVGAVHDFSALVLSIRHKGQSVGTIARDVISPRTRLLFLLVIFFLVALAMGVFVLVISGLFAAPDAANIPATAHPEAVFPTYSLMLIAMVIGFLVYKKNFPLWPMIGVGFVLMLVTTRIGLDMPVTGFTAGDWTWSLLIYAFIASVLPVWLLLQPRDFLNSLLLRRGRLAAGLTEKPRELPMRKCLACREQRPKADMLRLVVDENGLIWPDLRQCAPGRGTYFCMREKCLSEMSDKRLQALKGSFSVVLPQWQALRKRLTDALEQAIGQLFSRLRPTIDIGRDAVMHRLWNNAPQMVICAADAGDALVRQIDDAVAKRRQAGQVVSIVNAESAVWLGGMFDREKVAVAGLDVSPMAKKLKQYCVWLGHVKVSG